MPFAFNKQLWDAGRQIEDAALPELNKYFKTPLYCGVFLLVLSLVSGGSFAGSL